MAFNTPILLITFNRPDHTRRVLERILEAKPQELYVFQDGAREGNANDAAKCAEVRQVIDTLWNNYLSQAVAENEKQQPHLHRYYSDINLGCGPGPMTGITWFFDNVEQGIVMEDDCLAHPDFFPYCEELLNRYKGTEAKFINATLYDDSWTCVDSYGFSRYMITGAWASYREVWQGFDLDLHTMDAKAFGKIVYELTQNKVEANWWYFKVLEIKQDRSKKSYWDYQMQIHLFNQHAYTIHPQKNLISNIGFDAEGTHTWGDDGRADRPTNPILPLRHPEKIYVDVTNDHAAIWARANSQGWLKDMINYVYKSMLYSNGVLHQFLMLYKKLKGK